MLSNAEVRRAMVLLQADARDAVDIDTFYHLFPGQVVEAHGNKVDSVVQATQLPTQAIHHSAASTSNRREFIA